MRRSPTRRRACTRSLSAALLLTAWFAPACSDDAGAGDVLDAGPDAAQEAGGAGGQPDAGDAAPIDAGGDAGEVADAGTDAAPEEKDAEAPENAAPLADAGDDRDVRTHVRTRVDGSGSSDADDDTLTYAWTLIDKPGSSKAALSDADEAVAYLTPDKAGDYVLRLVVDDGEAESAPSTVTLTATPARILVAGDSAHAELADRIDAWLDWEVDAPWQFAAALVQVSGDFIAWVDGYNTGGYVIGLDDTDTRFDIARHSGLVGGIDIEGNLLVWGDERNQTTHKMDIYAYDIVTETETRITNGANLEHKPSTNGDAIFWEEIEADDRAVHGFRVSDSAIFAIDDSAIEEQDPQVAGDYVVYVEVDALSDSDVYGFRISTATRFGIGTGAGFQGYPLVAGDYVVYAGESSALTSYKLSDASGGMFATGSQAHHDGVHAAWWEMTSPGNYAVKTRDFATGTVTTIRNTTSGPRYPYVETPLVAWIEVHPTTGMDVHVYDLTTTTHTVVTNAPGTQDLVSIHDGRLFWFDGEYDRWDIDLIRLDAVGGTPENLSAPGMFRVREAIANIADYDAVVFGDKLSSGGEWGLSNLLANELFAAADEAGVPALAFDGEMDDDSLARLFSYDGRFALSKDTNDGVAPVAIETGVPEHPIFDGLAFGAPLALHTGSSVTMEECSVSTDALDAMSPADWTELAVFGPAASLAGEAAIVEFTTANGTAVILDGTADTHDDYAYWTPARETLLLNEVHYLVGRRAP